MAKHVVNSIKRAVSGISAKTTVYENYWRFGVEHIEDLGNDEYNLYYEYQIDDEDVSEDAHNAAVEADFDFANSQRLNENEVTYDVIRQQILDF